MNIRGNHFRISASTRGDDGLRPSESKKISYRFMNDGLLSLYRVQLHCQHQVCPAYEVTHSISLKYSSTRPSAILRPGTPAISHSRWPFDSPLSFKVLRTSLNSRFSSAESEIMRPSLKPQPKEPRPGFGLCVSAVGNKPEGGGLCGSVCRSGNGAERG